MHNTFTVTLLLGAGALFAQAQPRITPGGVVNSASYAAPGLPNAAIAQGSLFVVFGSGMGPSALEQITAYPLSTTLGGTSLSVTVNGTSTKPLLVYTSGGQVGAILPSGTPAGTGTITVSYNGQTSAPQQVTVATSSFGIYSVNQAGSGQGIITNTGYQVAGMTNASNPGEAYIVWGTGLGPVTGDEAAGGSAVKLGTIPVEVLVGGKQASVIGYARAGCCAGLDQIAFYVPAGVSGCSVPVAVKIGNVVSNYVALSIAASGRTCSDPSGINPVTVSQNGVVSTGGLDLSRSSINISVAGQNITSVTDSASGSFERVTYSNYSTNADPLQISTYGSCTVFTFQGSTPAVPTGSAVPMILDAGPTLTLNGPGGPKTLSKSNGSYFAMLGGGTTIPGVPSTATPLYLTKGTYTITGPGGADVGPFTATLNVPDPLNWTNSAAITNVTRAGGQQITWSGGDPAGNVYIIGFSISGATAADLVGAEFVCVERTSSGQFTIPPFVLLSLPVTPASETGAGTSALAVEGLTMANFKASGLDQGIFSSSNATLKTVNYQ